MCPVPCLILEHRSPEQHTTRAPKSRQQRPTDAPGKHSELTESKTLESLGPHLWSLPFWWPLSLSSFFTSCLAFLHHWFCLLLESVFPLVPSPRFHTQAQRTWPHLTRPKVNVRRLEEIREIQGGDSGSERGRKLSGTYPLPRLSHSGNRGNLNAWESLGWSCWEMFQTHSAHLTIMTYYGKFRVNTHIVWPT